MKIENLEFNTFKNLFGFIDPHIKGTVFDNSFFHILFIILSTYIIIFIFKFLFKFIFENFFQKTKTKLDDDILEIIQKPFFNTIWIITIVLSFGIFFENSSWWLFFYKTSYSFILIFWFIGFKKITEKILDSLSKQKKIKFINKQTIPIFENLNLLLFFIIGFSVISSLIWDINLTTFVASLGVVGLAVGFAAKDTISNLFAGVFILIDQPYKLGDIITVDSETRGLVIHIGIRSTRLVSDGDIEVTIPNSIIGNKKILNESSGPKKKKRIKINISVAYGSDIDKIEKIILKAVNNQELVLDTPESIVRFISMGASSLDYLLLFWIEDPRKTLEATHIMNTVVYKTLMEEGFEIPYQKQDLYIKELPFEKNKK